MVVVVVVVLVKHCLFVSLSGLVILVGLGSVKSRSRATPHNPASSSETSPVEEPTDVCKYVINIVNVFSHSPPR